MPNGVTGDDAELRRFDSYQWAFASNYAGQFTGNKTMKKVNTLKGFWASVSTVIIPKDANYRQKTVAARIIRRTNAEVRVAE